MAEPRGSGSSDDLTPATVATLRARSDLPAGGDDGMVVTPLGIVMDDREEQYLNV